MKNIENIIEEWKKIFNFPKETLDKWLDAFAKEIEQSTREETIEEVERDFENQKYNIDPRLGEFLSKKGILNLIQSKKEKI